MAKVYRVWSENGRIMRPVSTDDPQDDRHAPSEPAGQRAAAGQPRSGPRSDARTEPGPRAEFADSRYRLENRLGGGAGSDVYRAVDLMLRRPVALKVYRSGAGAQAERLFLEQARQLAWLDHANLVTLYDAGIHDGHPFLVLQYVDGVTLATRLEQGALSIDQTIAVGTRLADVLAYVHQRGVVHRDVKPGSVLVDEGDVYLADFGISRMLGAAPGTPVTSAYLAPEQVHGRTVGTAADVYSLGLVLLECLTGEVQYPSSPLATAVARLNRRPVVPPDLPEPLHDALEAMLADDPAGRPSAEECRAAFALCDPAADEPPPSAHAARDNVYSFDDARRRRPADPRGTASHRAGAHSAASQTSEYATFGAARDDEDTQPLPLVDLDGPFVAGAPAGAGHRHRVPPQRRRRWLRLAATGAVGVALAGGVVALAAPRETTVRRVAGPSPAAPSAAGEPRTPQRQTAPTEPRRASRERRLQRDTVAPRLVPQPGGAAAQPAGDRTTAPATPPRPSASPTPCPTPTSAPGLIGGLLGAGVAALAPGDGATGSPTASPAPSAPPTDPGDGSLGSTTTGPGHPDNDPPPCAA